MQCRFTTIQLLHTFNNLKEHWKARTKVHAAYNTRGIINFTSNIYIMLIVIPLNFYLSSQPNYFSKIIRQQSANYFFKVDVKIFIRLQSKTKSNFFSKLKYCRTRTQIEKIFYSKWNRINSAIQNNLCFKKKYNILLYSKSNLGKS